MAAVVPGPLLRVAAATTLVVFAFSMLNPVLAVRLQASGHSATAIGVFVMLPFLAVAAMVPLMPRVFAALGMARAYRAGLLYGIARGWELPAAAKLGSVMGALKIGYRGAQNHAPSLGEIEKRFRGAFGYSPWKG